MLERDRYRDVLVALADTRVVGVAGARQVGKSTLLRALVERDLPASTFTFDRVEDLEAARLDPRAFVRGASRPAVIDEVQRVPEVLLEIKALVDEDPAPGQFLLSGSIDIRSSPRLQDSLPGRMELIELWPLRQAEIESTGVNLVRRLFDGAPVQLDGQPRESSAYAERVGRGGFPEARLREGPRRSAWFRAYLDAVFARDVASVRGVRNAAALRRLLRQCAAQAAGIVVHDRLGRQSGVDPKTAAEYLALLEAVYLVKTLPAWKRGLSGRERSQRKLYIVDSGLHLHLLHAGPRRFESDGRIAGMALENFVAMEVLRAAQCGDLGIEVHHYRRDGVEVDLVLEDEDGRVVAMEVKAAPTVRAEDARGLRALRDALGDAFVAGVVLHTGERSLPIGDRCWGLPISALWVP